MAKGKKSRKQGKVCSFPKVPREVDFGTPGVIRVLATTISAQLT
jgi:hypothetical protein